MFQNLDIRFAFCFCFVFLETIDEILWFLKIYMFSAAAKTAFLCAHRSTILQQQFNRVGRAEHGSVALPGVIRSGSIGTESLSMGTMPSAQQQITMGQMHRGHMPPLVRAAAAAAVEPFSVLLVFFPSSYPITLHSLPSPLPLFLYSPTIKFTKVLVVLRSQDGEK